MKKNKFSLDTQRDPSMTRTLRRTYERKISGLFVGFNAKAKEALFDSREFEAIKINFVDYTEKLSYLIEANILEPSVPIIERFVNEFIKAGNRRAGAFLRSVGVQASLGEINVDQRVYTVLRERNLSALKGITDEMSKKINSQLSEGILKGESMAKLSKRLADETGMSIKRARTMARTETMFAFNTAKDEEFKRYGVEKVEWVAALDERMCPTCGSYHGKIYDIDKVPDCPAHPNCRCTTIPYIDVEVD